jgi:hypothetical protein
MGKPKKLWVSDHALIRYFERYVGLDIEKFKQEFIKKVKKYVTDKNGRFKTPYGYIVVKNAKVVTILTEEQAEQYNYYLNKNNEK